MAEQEEKLEFTPKGEDFGFISLPQARVLAIQTARANPARRRWIRQRRMGFNVLNDYEDEDNYTIVLSFRIKHNARTSTTPVTNVTNHALKNRQVRNP